MSHSSDVDLFILGFRFGPERNCSAYGLKMSKLLKSELITKKSFRLDQAHTHAPFTSSSARFKSKKVQARMAHLGPATYDVNSQSIAVQSIRDAILKKTMKGKNSLICTNNTVTHAQM